MWWNAKHDDSGYRWAVTHTHTHTNSQLTSKWLKCVSKNTTQLLRASIENCWNYTTKRNSIEMCAAVGCCRVYLTRLYNNKYICMYIFFALNHSRTLFVYEITHTHCSARNWENEIKIQRKRNSIEDRKKESLSFRTTNWMVKIVGVHRRSTTTRENRCSYVNYSRVCVGGESKRECGRERLCKRYHISCMEKPVDWYTTAQLVFFLSFTVCVNAKRSLWCM